MEEINQKRILTIVSAAASSILNALFILYACQLNGFALKNTGFLVMVTGVVFLPHCLSFLERWQVSVHAVQWITVILSAVIVCGYAFAVVQGSVMNLLKPLLILHMFEGISVAAGLIVSGRQKKKS